MESKEVEKTMRDLGYYKKDVLRDELMKKIDTIITKPSPNNTYFTTPTNKKYMVTREGDLLFSGNIPADVTGVFINNYRLKSYVRGSKKFYFRASTTLGNLKDGANTYTLAFEEGGKPVIKESLTLYRALSDEEFATKEKEYATKNMINISNTAMEEAKKNQEKKSLEAKITALDPTYYYNKDLKKININLSYTNQSSSFDFAAVTNEITSSLKLLGIETTIQELNTGDIQKIVSN